MRKTETGLKQSMLEQFISISASIPNLQRLILFGSRAKGSYKYNSDIDLACVSTGPIRNQYDLDMEEAAGLYKLDLLDLATLTDTLLLEEIKQGVVLFDRNRK